MRLRGLKGSLFFITLGVILIINTFTGLGPFQLGSNAPFLERLLIPGLIALILSVVNLIVFTYFDLELMPNRIKKPFQLLFLWEMKSSLSSPIVPVFLGVLAAFSFTYPCWYILSAYVPYQKWGINMTAENIIFAISKPVFENIVIWFTMFVPLLFAFSFAGTYESGILTNELSQPVKRSEVFFSKFLANFLTVYAVSAIPMVLGVKISDVEGVFPLHGYLIELFSIFLLVFFISSISTLASVATNRAIAAAILPITFLAVSNSMATSESLNFLSLSLDLDTLTLFLASLTGLLSNSQIIQITEVYNALTYLAIISTFSILIAFILFKRKEL